MEEAGQDLKSEQAAGLQQEDESAAVIKAGFTSKEYDARDIAMDILGFFLTAAVAFAWMMLMLLIISFVSLSYLHFEIKAMVLVSLLTAVTAMVIYVVKKVKKYRILKARQERKGARTEK